MAKGTFSDAMCRSCEKRERERERDYSNLPRISAIWSGNIFCVTQPLLDTKHFFWGCIHSPYFDPLHQQQPLAYFNRHQRWLGRFMLGLLVFIPLFTKLTDQGTPSVKITSAVSLLAQRAVVSSQNLHRSWFRGNLNQNPKNCIPQPNLELQDTNSLALESGSRGGMYSTTQQPPI